MAYIYKITNDINQKVYIGKTEQTVAIRFAEHCRESKKERSKNRPLYRAMNKYGLEYFSVETIEETDNPEEREQFWIQYYNSYGKNGYNATAGGDGKRYLDYEQIVNLYQEYHNVSKVAKELKCDVGWTSKIIQSQGVKIIPSEKISQETRSKRVAKIDPTTNEVIELYPSVNAAMRDNGNPSHIFEVCEGKRKTCCGYKWVYVNEDESG